MSELADESASESVPLVPQRTTGYENAVRCIRTVGKWSLDNILLLLTITSVIVGTVIGLGTSTVLDVTEIEGPSDSTRIAYELIKFPGELFLRMLKMLILPLIMFSLIAGLGSLEAKVAGALGWKTIVYYLTTTLLAIILGILLVMTIKPGSNHGISRGCNNATVMNGEHLDTMDSILDLLRNLVPDNLFQATFLQAQTHYSSENITDWQDCVQGYTNETVNCSRAKELVETLNLSCENSTHVKWSVSVGTREGMNVLGIIVFSIAFALVLGHVAGGRKIVQAIAVLNEAIMKLVTVMMWYSPIGIASIIAGKLIEVTDFVALMEDIGLYFTTVMLGLFIHGCITLPLLYLLLTRKNPLKLVRAVLQALLTAFGISSSSATLPITIRCLEENFGADSRVTRFMLPVGATINMDGTALYEAVAAIFIAQYENQNPSFADVIIISITATAASIGAAGIPQAGLVTLLIVLVAIGLPTESVAIILTVDWLLDRFRTTINVLGDSFGVGIVEHYSRRYLDGHPEPANGNHDNENFQLEERNDMTVPSSNRHSPQWSPSQSHNSSNRPLGNEAMDSGSYGQRSSVDYGTSRFSPPSSTPPTSQWSLSSPSPPEKPRVFMSGSPLDDQAAGDDTKL